MRNPKKPSHKYFDLKKAMAVDAAGKPYAAFLHAYANYVFYRMKNFSSKYGTSIFSKLLVFMH
jgi:hypothetical protein